jgi:hypothetical protein
MAIDSNTQWNVRTDGSDTNGAGFVFGATGTDYSRQAAANSTGSNISTTDAVAAGTTTITSATAAFTSAITGNIIYLQGGSGSLTAGWYQATYVSATSITVDRTVASGTGITMNIGGALLTLSRAFTNMVSGNTVHVKTGTYPITSQLAITGNNPWALIGYGSIPNDWGTPPTITTATNSINLLSLPFGQNTAIANINFTTSAATKGNAISVSGGNTRITGVTITGFVIGINCGSNANLILLNSTITGCSSNGISANSGSHFIYASTISGNASTGITANSADMALVDCLVVGGSSNGLVISGAGQVQITNCTIARNTGAGISVNGVNFTGRFQMISSIIHGNGSFGLGASGTIASPSWTYYVRANAWGSNTSGNYASALGAGLGDKTLTADPFTDYTTGDFSLNSATGGGALCKGAGYPTNRDIGAVQTLASSSTVSGNYGFIG